MVAAVNVNTVVNGFLHEYLKNNKKATEQDCQTAVRSHLQDLKKNGAKISDKKIVQASAQVTELYKANVMTKLAKMSAKAVKSLNTLQAVHNYPKYNAHLAADHHYDEFHQLGKKARKRLHQKNMDDAKAAFSQLEVQDLPKAELSNSQNKKLMRESGDAYISSKKRKQLKKEAEAASQAEHKAQRLRNNPKDKVLRKAKGNAEYCTSQGIMTKNARKIFKNISQKLDGKFVITEKPNLELKTLNDYYRSLESTSAPVITETPKPILEIPKPKANVQGAVETVTTAGTKAASSLSKTVGKAGGKAGWLFAGFAAMTALGAALISSDKKEQQKNIA